MHAGHMESSSARATLGSCFNACVHHSPALGHAPSMLLWNHSKSLVLELDQRPAVLLAEPVLNVVGDGIRHEQGAGKLQERGPFDRLHMRPEMAVAIAEIAVPAPAGPGLDLHRHLALRGFI